MTEEDRTSLYVLLAEEASEAAAPGETLITKAKETLDNDAEASAVLGVDSF